MVEGDQEALIVHVYLCWNVDLFPWVREEDEVKTKKERERETDRERERPIQGSQNPFFSRTFKMLSSKYP